jgi:3-oxoacyl-[acyl-carrier-protein] synthase-3
VTGSRISGLGVALPSSELTNTELAQRLNRSEAWIEERTGIVSRRIASETDTVSDLGASASRRALADARVAVADVTSIICATITPQWAFPSTGCLIQHALGATAPAFDLNAGCSGFLFGLAQADAMVRSGSAERVLVVGTEVLSRIVDRDDVGTSILFGDGAGAAVVEGAQDGAEMGPFRLFSDGSRPELLFLPHETGLIHMQGREVYRAAVEAMAGSIADVLSRCGFAVSEVDLVVAHQANQRILDGVAQRLGLEAERVFSNIRFRGNTSAASIPLALFDAKEQGRLNDGDLVVIAAFGAGFAWGAGVVRWGTPQVAPIPASVREAVDA